jgi:hypothetical protein
LERKLLTAESWLIDAPAFFRATFAAWRVSPALVALLFAGVLALVHGVLAMGARVCEKDNHARKHEPSKCFYLPFF